MIIKNSYIRKLNPKKFRVYSEKGRNLGTYQSKAEAIKRLREIEYFKKNNADDSFNKESSILKKTNKLKVISNYLSDLGFKKEASKIDKMKAALLILFISLGLFGAHSAANIDFKSMKDLTSSLMEKEDLEKDVLKKNVLLGSSFDDIISQIYPEVKTAGKERIIKELIEQYNPKIKFSKDGVLEEREPSIQGKSIDLIYPDIKNIMKRFSQVLSSGYDVTETGILGEMSLSEDAKKSLMASEGFSKKIYNDNKGFVWPKDRNAPKAKGHWTIGYGHRLKEKELETGYIYLADGSKIPWTAGITESKALKVKANDLVETSILAAGLSKDTVISRPMYEALADLSFNIGPTSLYQFVASIKDDSGNLSSELFAREISGWTKVSEPSKRKGILIRRISELLTARGILIPEKPEHILEDTISLDSVMKLPSSSLVFDYLKSYNKDLTEQDAERVLKILSKDPPESASDFINAIKRGASIK